jgi:hypothetical protein
MGWDWRAEGRDINDEERDQNAMIEVGLNVEIGTREKTLADEPPSSPSRCDRKWSCMCCPHSQTLSWLADHSHSVRQDAQGRSSRHRRMVRGRIEACRGGS